MVKIKYLEDKNKFSIKIEKSENYLDISSFLYQDRNFTYIKASKTFEVKPPDLNFYLKEITELDEVLLSRKDNAILEQNKPVKNITKTNKKLNDCLFVYPPKKGKYPFENYQKEDIELAYNFKRFGIFWDMGLGKTYLASVLLSNLFYTRDIDKCLYVCNSDGIINTKRELLKFSNIFNSFDIKIIFTSEDLRKDNIINNKYKIVLVTYNTYKCISDDWYKENNKKARNRRSLKYYKPPIPFQNWGKNRCIVLDECQAIQNPKSQVFKKLNIHKEYFDYRYIMSGTPSPNGIEGFYALFKFLDEKLVPYSWYTFLHWIGKKFSKFSKEKIEKYNEENVKNFRDMISSYCVKRLSEDCLNLPDKIIKPVYCQLKKNHYKMYKDYVNFEIKELQRKGIIYFKALRLKFHTINLILDNPNLLAKTIDENVLPKLYKNMVNFKFKNHSKIPMVNELLEKHKDEKIILWSGHPDSIDHLYNYLLKKKKKVLKIHGQIKGYSGNNKLKIKDDILNNFKNGDYDVLVASYYVLSTSVNIVEATIQIFFDRSYALEKWLQSIKRSHRIGQEKRVLIYTLIFEQTVEETLNDVLTKKEEFDKKFLDDSELNLEDLKYILGGKR